MIITLIGITMVVFLVIQMAPGDPVTKQLSQGSQQADGGGQVTAEKLKKFKRQYNLDKPWFLNFRPFMNYSGMVEFFVDFFSRPVSERREILQKFHTGERTEGYEYLVDLKIPELDESLKDPTQRKNLAEKTIQEALFLNIPDHSTWIIPLLVEKLDKSKKRIERETGDLYALRKKLRRIKEQVKFKKLEKEEGKQKASEVIQTLNQKLKEHVSQYEDGLPKVPNRDDPEKNELVAVKHRWRYWKSQYEDQLGGYLPGYRKETIDEQLADLDEGDPRESIREQFQEKDLSYLLEKLLKAGTPEEARAPARVLSVLAEEQELGVELRVTPDAGIDRALDLSEFWGNWWLEQDAGRLKKKLQITSQLLNISARRPFPYTFKASDKNLDEKTRNVKFVWGIWWQKEKHTFKPVPEKRRQEVDEILSELGDLSAKERVNKIRYELKRSDLPHVVDRLQSADDPAFVAVTSQVLIHSIPGDPLKAQVGKEGSMDEVFTVLRLWGRWWEQNRSRYEFSLPGKLWHMVSQTQYSLYMANLATLNFGETMSKPHEPVLERIERAAWRTGPLVALSQIFIYLIAIPLGVVCAVKHGTLIDRGLSLQLYILYSIPGYAAAMVLLSLFGNPTLEAFQIFPSNGVVPLNEVFKYGITQGAFWTTLLSFFHHAVLPVFCLTIFSLAALSMYSRTSMLEVIQEDYVRTARAKGLPESIVVGKHVVRNGLNPLITLFAGFLNVIIGGSVIIEKIFEIDGMGLLFLNAAVDRDYNLLMGLLVLNSILVLVGILISDLLYVVADPRISFEEVEQ